MIDYQDQEPKYTCSLCFGEIYPKENYYNLDGEIFCEKCVSDALVDGYNEYWNEKWMAGYDD